MRGEEQRTQQANREGRGKIRTETQSDGTGAAWAKQAVEREMED